MWQLTDCIEPPVVLAGDPELPETLQAALNLQQQGQIGEAERIYTGFLDIHPNHPQALAFLGACLAHNGRFPEADRLLARSIQIAPSLADPRYCRAGILAANGQLAQAVTPYSYAYALGHPKAGERLDSLLNQLGTAERAISHRILATFDVSRNMMEPALENSCKAVQLEPGVTENWLIFSRVVSRIRFNTEVSRELLDSLTMAFAIPGLDYQMLAGAAISALMHDSSLKDFNEACAASGDLQQALIDGSLGALAENPLLCRILPMVLVTNPYFERSLTKLRAALLLGFNSGKLEQSRYLGLTTSLAQQCFLNGYLWVVSDEERAAIENINEKLADILKERADQEISSELVAILAMYQPLYQHVSAGQLQHIESRDNISAILQQQLYEPLEEQRLAAEIPAVLPESSATSLEIREQYEESPYPRWTNVPALGEPVTLEQYISHHIPGLSSTERLQAINPQILVAGCGTGKAANYLAQHIRQSAVTAIDLSLKGLAYARRKSDQLGLQSVEYLQGDILNLPRLERQFDHINCYGVLHHLADAGEGLGALAECLAPNGTMQIGVYSEIAQKPLIHARNFILNRVGSTPTVDDVRYCRQAIIDQKHDPLLNILLDAPNFYNLDDFWNLVVRYQESYITLSELQRMIDSLGLRFIGFQHNDPTVVMRYQKRFPQDPEMRSLEYWAEFETVYPDTFRSIYNFWLFRPD